MTNDTEYNVKLQQAVEMFINRKNRDEHPDGDFDGKKRFYPDSSERQTCCDSIRTPPARFPFSLMVHCRTIEHIAHLFDVDVKDLRKAVRTAQPAKREGGEDYYKAVAVLNDGSMVSIFDGETEYKIGETVREQPRQNHVGGTYVYKTKKEAENAALPKNSKAKDYPRVILRVRAEGSYCRYENKLSFSQVTPIEIIGEVRPFSEINWLKRIAKRIAELGSLEPLRPRSKEIRNIIDVDVIEIKKVDYEGLYEAQSHSDFWYNQSECGQTGDCVYHRHTGESLWDNKKYFTVYLLAD